jgi:integrative and conjugative element protein (TIGR02256 family)
MTPLEYRSSDKQFGLQLHRREFQRLIRWCAVADRIETGGILIGTYNPQRDTAIVSHVLPAPADSKAGPTWFERGIKGLRAALEQAWQTEHTHYLGEWHYHPNAAPNPSPRDQSQMRDLKLRRGFRVVEPIMLIIGGHSSSQWATRAFVYPNTGMQIELLLLQNIEKTLRAAT